MRPACTRAFCAPRVRIARIRVLRCSAARAHSDHLAARPLGAIHQQPPSGWQLVHVALCKIMYHEWAYGPAELTWPELRVPHTAAEAIALLGDGHALLRSDLLGFSEADLDVPRRTNWGQSWPAWRIFTVMTITTPCTAARSVICATSTAGPTRMRRLRDKRANGH